MGNKLYIVIFNIIFFTAMAYGQNAGICCSGVKGSQVVPVAANFWVNELPAKREQFYNEWQKGVICFNNGRFSDTVTIRYNRWTDELLWLRESDYKTAAVIKDIVTGFVFFDDNKTTTFKKISETVNFVTKDIYVEVISSGKVSLLGLRKVIYNKANNSFTQNNIYYIENDGQVVKSGINKKSFLNGFTPAEQDIIIDIMHKNHYKFKNELHIVETLNKFNQL